MTTTTAPTPTVTHDDHDACPRKLLFAQFSVHACGAEWLIVAPSGEVVGATPTRERAIRDGQRRFVL